MKKKIVYKDDPEDISDDYVVLKDFLPPPEKLIRKQGVVKVTLSLGSSSVDCFKQWAKESGTHYQTMIREVVDRYAAQYAKKHKVAK